MTFDIDADQVINYIQYYGEKILGLLETVYDKLSVVPLPVYMLAFVLLIVMAIIRKTLNAAISIAGIVLAIYVAFRIVNQL